MSKYAILLSFYSDLNKFHNLNHQKESTKEKKATVYDNALEPYKEYLEIYFYQYKTLSDAKKGLGKNLTLLILFVKHIVIKKWIIDWYIFKKKL